MATVKEVLSPHVTVLELLSGRLVLLHPVTNKEQSFLPCSYG